MQQEVVEHGGDPLDKGRVAEQVRRMRGETDQRPRSMPPQYVVEASQHSDVG